ncbi:MAG: hypothetical protein JXB39_09985 [Deltaproteobacteria bacterium]|nr:hypothetical protein [Deltaproteobacteria bacterium]
MRTFLSLSLVLAAGCGYQAHQYDHRRAYDEAFAAQADLTRRTVEGQEFPLSGPEGIALRARVEEATTDKEESDEVGGVEQ